jgi:L-ribulokinase
MFNRSKIAMENQYVIGLDFGTDSVRAVLVDASNGKQMEVAVHPYKRWKQGLFCDASINQFRQHPLDHIEGLEETIRSVVAKSGIKPESVKGICIDTTGSSPLPVNERGISLAETQEFENNPNAMMILWKDHTAIKEAEEINLLAKEWHEDYTRFEGGIYSSEWFWAKILHITRNDESIKKAAYSWMEHCDYLTFLLTGAEDLKSFKRSRCAAGHKAMWHKSWNGLPEDGFLKSLDKSLVKVKKSLYQDTFASDVPAGNLSQKWADKLGLTTSTIIAVGTFDAHAGAVGAEVKEGTLVRVMGTSTCDIIVSSNAELETRTVKGICGQVDGSVVPNMMGLEAGQSAFGDLLKWFADIILEPVEAIISTTAIHQNDKAIVYEALNSSLIPYLTSEAEKLPIEETLPIALDWINGRRTPDANQSLKSAMVNLSLGTKAPHIFKALVEAICFGSKKIVERFKDEGVSINDVVGIGGVAKKSPFVMQTLANVLNMPIKVANSEQAPALGSAMYAAVASGIYNSVEEAMFHMGNGFESTYFPEPKKVDLYQKRYLDYSQLGGFVEYITDTPKKMSPHSKYQLLKEECYEANMQLNELGLVVYTFGNVSAVDRENSVFAIKPSGVPYETLTPQDIVIVDFDNNVVEGGMRPSSDTKTHALLYKNWKDIGGISHTHALYSVSWAQAQMDIPIFGTTHADHLTTDIPCAPPMSDELVKGNYEHNTGTQILDCFKERNLDPTEVEMVLIGNHGPFTWGKTAAEAVYNSRVLEEIAQMAFITRQINPNAERLKDSLIKKHYERKHGKNAYYGQ